MPSTPGLGTPSTDDLQYSARETIGQAADNAQDLLSV